MRSSPLREIAKFLAGLVAADMITLMWVAVEGLLPLQTLGITITSSILLPAFVFDVALLIILIHYGWHIGKIPRPRERQYLIVVGVLFTTIALLHLWRVFAGTALVLGGWSVPLWLSWVGVAVTAYLAYMSYHLAARR